MWTIRCYIPTEGLYAFYDIISERFFGPVMNTDQLSAMELEECYAVIHGNPMDKETNELVSQITELSFNYDLPMVILGDVNGE